MNEVYDKIIPIEQFKNLSKAAEDFMPFDILAFKVDPGYGYQDVILLLIKFKESDDLGLCIYNTTKGVFIEEPSDFDDYHTNEDILYQKYHIARSSYIEKLHA